MTLISELHKAEDALGTIIAETRTLEDYFTGPYSTWYSTVVKTRIRAKEIIKECNKIIECMNKMEAERTGVTAGEFLGTHDI